MDAFGIVIGFNVFENIHAGLFGIVIFGILNKLTLKTLVCVVLVRTTQ